MARSLVYTMRSIAIAMVSALLAVEPVYAKSEQDVKAAYLYNFIKFVNWPENLSSNTYPLCLLGEDAINDKLAKLDQKQVRGKTLEVVKLNSYDTLISTDCRILFIGQSEEKFLNEIFTNTDTMPTLTISSIEDFADAGGVIGFVKLGNVIRFNINLKQANLSELSISAKLLELANKVVK